MLLVLRGCCLSWYGLGLFQVAVAFAFFWRLVLHLAFGMRMLV
jgi:hypothetical protein